MAREASNRKLDWNRSNLKVGINSNKGRAELSVDKKTKAERR